MAAPVKLNSSMVDELKKSFRLRDYDNDGKIFSRDIGPTIRSVNGLCPAEAEIREIVAEVDRQGGNVKLDQLVKLISQIVTMPERESADSLAEMFRSYDHDGRGHIAIQDMLHVLTNIGEKLREDEALDLVKLSGAEESKGVINYRKFVQVVVGR